MLRVVFACLSVCVCVWCSATESKVCHLQPRGEQSIERVPISTTWLLLLLFLLFINTYCNSNSSSGSSGSENNNNNHCMLL